MQYVAVIDIGKTNAKLILVDLKNQSEIAVKTTPNKVIHGAPYPHHDLDMLWGFFKNSFREFSLKWDIEAITISAHGGSVVLLDEAAGLATPMLDYEFSGIDEFSDEYDAIRPKFSETGSPRLASGLNIGAQLFWLFKRFSNLKNRTATILTYPQYWAYLLSGIKTCEVTSLGCHSDLWDPQNYTYSSLVKKLNIDKKMPPVHKAGDKLGTLLPELATELGLSKNTPIYCGIHDSNASLVPHLLSRSGSFSVVSTGTWVISMAMEGKLDALDPKMDTLINVNAFGSPVASSRFMGGREFEMLMGARDQTYSEVDIEYVLKNKISYYPAKEPSCGPYKGMQGNWSTDEAVLSDGQRMVAVSYYLAMVTSTCLSSIANAGEIIVEGPFARNELFISMLGAITGETIYTPTQSMTGTAIGASLLINNNENSVANTYNQYLPDENPLRLIYAKNWSTHVNSLS